jgi:hypothetical protein
MSCRVPPAALGDLPIHDWEAPISRLSFTISVIIFFSPSYSFPRMGCAPWVGMTWMGKGRLFLVGRFRWGDEIGGLTGRGEN